MHMANTSKVSHYKIFEFQQKMTNRFICNYIHQYRDYSQANGQVDVNFRIDANQVPLYELDLINEQLYLVVFDQGVGKYPAPNQYMHFRKRIYLEGENRDIKREIVFSQYGVKQNLEPLQLILSMSKCGFRARAFLGSNFKKKMLNNNNSPSNKRLVLQLHIVAISQFPLNDKFSELSKFNNQIIRSAIKGDQAFEQRDLQASLFNYQIAISKIFSQYFVSSLTKHKRTITKHERQTLKMLTSRNKREEKDQQIEQMIQNREIALEIEEFTEKIVLKGIQVALLAKEYFKVVKWVRLLMVNPKYQSNLRLLMIRAKAFVQLDEPEKALTDLRLIVKLNPSHPVAKQQIQAIEKKQASIAI